MIINAEHAVTHLKLLRTYITIVPKSVRSVEVRLKGSYLPQVSGSRDQAFTARITDVMEEENKT